MAHQPSHQSKIAIELDHETIERMRNIAQRWNKVEENLKRVEFLREEAAIPSINELRYAGRRIVDGMLTLVGNEKRTNPTSKSFESYMIEAERCCENADHDIIDATLAYVTSHLASVVRDFGLKNVAIFFPDYSHVRSRLKQLQSLVLESRADRSRRDEIYDTLLRGFDEIVEFETTILAVEDDILLAVQSEQARENRTKWITRVSLGFGFIGIVIGFVGLVY